MSYEEDYEYADLDTKCICGHKFSYDALEVAIVCRNCGRTK